MITEQKQAQFKEDPSALAENSINNIHVFIDRYLSVIQLVLADNILSVLSIEADISCTILLPITLKYFILIFQNEKSIQLFRETKPAYFLSLKR